jgi:apolipoprotein D and lipocalin family protein
MNVFGAFVFLAGFLLGAQSSSAQATSISPLTAVDNVDLRRYAGKWYELPRYPNRFQRNCQSDEKSQCHKRVPKLRLQYGQSPRSAVQKEIYV